MVSSDTSLDALMKQAQSGDKKAYADLLHRVSQELRPFLKKRLASPDDVEDLLQEILISIHKARRTYDATRPFAPWMYAIAKFRLNDFLRKQYRDVFKDADDYHALENQLSAPQEDSKRAQREELDKAMETLPERQQRIIFLMKVEGYTAKEVADELGMQVSAVKVAAHRAYKKLKQEMLAHQNVQR